MKKYILPVAVNLASPLLEPEIYIWMLNSQLIPGKSHLKVVQEQKITWFAGYLFPKMETHKLELITKFFCCLFVLDDLLDEKESKDSSQLLNALISIASGSKIRFSEFKLNFPDKALIEIINQLIHSISFFGNESWKSGFYANWKDYLMAQHWEVTNKQKGRTPFISEYKEMRLFSSGVYLALHLLKKDWENQECLINWVEQKVARIICLSNDLKSVEKERKDQDFHNELLLLQMQTGCSNSMVYTYANTQIEGLFDQLFSLLELLAKRERYPKAWVNELLLLLGGCMYWSNEDTARYGESLNGLSKY